MALEYVSILICTLCLFYTRHQPTGFVLSKATPDLNTSLGYKMFLLFATINIGGMAVFSLYESSSLHFTCKSVFSPPSCRLIPETKGRSLEEMDIIFGSISAEQRRGDIDKRRRGTSFSNLRFCMFSFFYFFFYTFFIGLLTHSVS